MVHINTSRYAGATFIFFLSGIAMGVLAYVIPLEDVIVLLQPLWEILVSRKINITPFALGVPFALIGILLVIIPILWGLYASKPILPMSLSFSTGWFLSFIVTTSISTGKIGGVLVSILYFDGVVLTYYVLFFSTLFVPVIAGAVVDVIRYQWQRHSPPDE